MTIDAERCKRWQSDAEHSEYWLILSVQTSASNMWAENGHEVAREAFCLTKSLGASALPPIKKLEHSKIESSGRILSISSPTSLLLFDKIKAQIVSWKVKGQHMIYEGCGPCLTFWRAPTDNDKGGALGEWKGHRVHEMRQQIRSVRHKTDENTGALEIVVRSYIAPPALAWGFKTTTKYTIHSDGKLRIHTKSTPKGPAPETLPRVGLEMTLPRDLNICQWLGLGPGQTYRDMKEARQVGVWKFALDDMMYMYEMPQENGNRTDTRWVRVSNERGIGIKAILERTDTQAETVNNSSVDQTTNDSDSRSSEDHHVLSLLEGAKLGDREKGKTRSGFDFSVSKFTAYDLDRAQHPHELQSTNGGVVFRIDDDHHGLGTAACGPDVLDQYKLKMRTFDFSVSLEPISGLAVI